MCDKCDGYSRREVLKGVAGVLAGAIALGLWGCGEGGPAVGDLPDGVVYEDHLKGEAGTGVTSGPVKIDPKKIVVPPPVPAEQTGLGEIMPRRSWSMLPLMLAAGVPINGVKRITIHHSGDGKPFTGESVEEVARHLQIVQQAHLQRGMIDIAYHFAVDRVGRVWQLRWLHYEGQHVRLGKGGVRNNANNVGIVVLGDFNVQGVTVPARDRLFALVRLVRKEYSLLPAAVAMHGELVETDCPGKALRPLIVEARKRGVV